ncbi:unnamed protein product, partial [marine sediment metagenome]
WVMMIGPLPLGEPIVVYLEGLVKEGRFGPHPSTADWRAASA